MDATRSRLVESDTAKPRIQSVARAAEILSAVADNANGLTAREISDAIGVRLPTVYHLLHTLNSTGLLRRDARTSRYIIGFAVGVLASGLERQTSVPDELLERVRAVGAETGETAYGSGWSDGEIVILVRTPGTKSVTVAELPLGLAVHAHSRASGKLLLALASDADCERYLERHPPVSLTKRTLGRHELLKQLKEIATQGYAVDEEEFVEGVCCVAAPFAIGGQTFGICLSAPTERFRTNRDAFREVLARMTRE